MWIRATIAAGWGAAAAWLVVASAGCAPDILTPLRTQTDEFVQNVAAQIDVAWVVDNSESMGEEQTGLGQSFEAFISNLVASGVDYHIGVISTDSADGGRLHAGAGTPAVIDTSVDDPKEAFLANVRVGTHGSRLERAFETAAMALGVGIGWQPDQIPSPPPQNAGFLREDAALFIIMVSDEDDKSFGPVSYYRRLFESYKGPGNEGLVSVSAIVGDPTLGQDAGTRGGCFDPQRGTAQPGDRYVDIAGQTGGVWTSICSDFNASLAELSITAAGLKAVFELGSPPDLDARLGCGDLQPEPFCVRVNGQPVGRSVGDDRRRGWTFDESRSAIVFGVQSIPPPQASIAVEYQEHPLS